jgi:hypothetical protein
MRVLVLALMVSGVAWAAFPALCQEAPPATESPADAPAQQTSGPAWQAFSASGTTVYLLDLASASTVDGITRVTMARVRKAGDVSDRTHGIEHYWVNCGQRRYRNPLSIEYGSDGTESERYDDGGGPGIADGIWDPISPNTNLEFIRALVCEQRRPNSAAFASIADFIAAGRPAT